ncbi:MAG: TadE/TadG family type IV pilus assembly protein [Chakrabartia sp.]
MTAPHPSPSRVVRLWADQRGIAMFELSAVLPFLLLVGLGSMEITANILARKRVYEIGRMVVDNAARISDGNAMQASTVRESDINDLLLGAQLQGGTLNLSSNGRIILTSLETNAQGGQWIHWQRCYGNAHFSSAYRAGQGAHGLGFAGIQYGGQSIQARPGDAVMFVEIAYDYRPMVSMNWAGYGTQRFVAAFAMNVRDKRSLAGLSPDAPAATC